MAHRDYTSAASVQVMIFSDRLEIWNPGKLSSALSLDALDLVHLDHFTNAYLNPALDAGLIEMTIPDKPRSSKQRYRLTDKGRAWLKDEEPTA